MARATLGAAALGLAGGSSDERRFTPRDIMLMLPFRSSDDALTAGMGMNEFWGNSTLGRRQTISEVAANELVGDA